MRYWLLLLALSGCLTPGPDVIPDEWPADPAIHPGMRLYFLFGDHYSQCTAGFMFASPDNQTLYLSVSAHCMHGDGDLELGAPAYASPPGGKTRPIGNVAFDGWSSGPETLARDFALVELSNREGVRSKANPAVPHWGGPLALATSQQAIPGTKVAAYGNSMGRDDPSGNPTLGRMVLSLDGTVRVQLDRPAISGDSGGPLMTWDGNALGILHGGERYNLGLINPEFDVFTPLDGAISMLRSEGREGVRQARLVTWSQWDGPTTPVNALRL